MISLGSIALGFLLVLVTFVARHFLKIFKVRRQLESWLPAAPRVPILGSALEFHGPTETLNDITRLLDNPSKSSYLEALGIPAIGTRNYDLVEFILTSNKILTKSEDYRYLNPWLGTGLLTSFGQKWKSHRKVITPAFHFSILEQFVDVFDSNIKVLIDKLKREALGKESVNIYEYLTACALDIICETAMGVKLESQNNKNQNYVDAAKSMCKVATIRSLSPWKRFDVLFRLTADYKKQCDNLTTLHNFTNSVIEQRKTELLEANHQGLEQSSQDDLGRKRKMAFLDLLLNATIDGQPMTQEEIREEVDTFMFAGHDTTSSGLSSAFFLLASNPKTQTLIREELKGIFGNDRNRPITYQDLQAMKYLELVIKEVLRLYPPAPGIARLIEEDVEYKGHVIPKGTIALIFIYGINRDADYYDEPEVFKPERFLDSSGKKPFYFIPFSAGPRNCIGQKYAMLEMKSILSQILMNFEILPANPPHKLLLTNEIVLKSLNGVNIKLQECKWE